MNAKQFLILLNKGNSLEKEDFQALVKLHENFPYFALPKILAAKYEKKQTGGTSVELLHWAAVQSPDRIRLKQLIEEDIDFLPPPMMTAAAQPTDEKNAGTPVQSEALPSHQTRDEILRRLEENLNRFKGASKKAVGDHQNIEAAANEPKKNTKAEDLIDSIKKKEKKAIIDLRKKEQNEIIKAFTKKSTQRAAVKENQDMANHTDLSKNSTAFNNKIITESFARLLVKQNNKDQAIEIYKKLILKFPNKSVYFAALIKELED